MQNKFVGMVTYQVYSPIIVYADVSIFVEFISSTTGVTIVTEKQEEEVTEKVVEEEVVEDEEGDSPVDITEYNFQVAILVSSGDDYKFIGNGVIIKEKYILTTASCLKT